MAARSHVAAIPMTSEHVGSRISADATRPVGFQAAADWAAGVPANTPRSCLAATTALVDRLQLVPGFVVSDEFAGAKPGHVFKRCVSGTGYYPDGHRCALPGPGGCTRLRS